MNNVMLDEHQLKDLAKWISKYYPYNSDEIYTVMLQTKSIDVTLSIVHYCTEMAYKLDYGVYCYLKYYDTEFERR